MKLSLTLALSACIASGSLALPILHRRQQQAPINDVDILQFALSLENLEASFYFEGLNKFSEADFRRENIPKPTQTFQNLYHILQHELQHVKTLQTVITSLGGTPVPPCEYQFPFQTVQQFMAIANSLEKVGVSAYNGALALMQSGDLQTAAATIDTVEARHASFLQTANGGDPFPENFDVALDGRQVITLASPFIKQCSFDLGFVPFGTLQIKQQIHLPESDVEVAFQQVGAQNFCNWLFSDQSIVVPLSGSRCKIPLGARGDVYLMITNDPNPVSLKKTNTIVAGPAIVTVDTAHTDSCKELFSGKKWKKLPEDKVNQPFNDALNDPSTVFSPVDSSVPGAYPTVGNLPGVTPPITGSVPLGVAPVDADVVPPVNGPPGVAPVDAGAVPSVGGLPGAAPSDASLVSTAPAANGTVVSTTDASINDMFAEIQALLDQPGLPPSTPVPAGTVVEPSVPALPTNGTEPVLPADGTATPVDPAAETVPADGTVSPADGTAIPVDPAAETVPADGTVLPADGTETPVDPAAEAVPADGTALPVESAAKTSIEGLPENLASASVPSPAPEAPVLDLRNNLISEPAEPSTPEFPVFGL